MYQLISYKDKENWNQLLSQFDCSDVYYFHGYCSSYLELGDGEPYLFVYESNTNQKIVYAFIKRPIDVSLYQLNTEKVEFYDITTPYGYGGPIGLNVDKNIMNKFRIEFDEYCKGENIVSEFIRFHPLFKNHEYSDDSVEVFYDRDTVCINLTESEKEIFEKHHKNHRRNITKARKKNLEFSVYTTNKTHLILDEFYQLYKETMDKLDASPYYYFSKNYFKSLLTNLEGHVIIAVVSYEEKIVAAALCILERGILYYHLGCSKQKYLHLGSNTYLFHNLSLWGKANNCHTFFLGGGYLGSDSLFQFKQRFNPEGVLQFYVGKKIHNKAVYDILVTNWESCYSQKVKGSFFPSYRNIPLVKNSIHNV